MLLANDITSAFRKTTYGKAGASVKMISVHGDALIVEDESGNRFAVNRMDLTDGLLPVSAVINELSAAPKPENMKSAPLKISTMPPIPTPRKRKIIDQQSSLF